MSITYRAVVGILLLVSLSMTDARSGSAAFAQGSQTPVMDKPFVVEYYYIGISRS